MTAACMHASYGVDYVAEDPGPNTLRDIKDHDPVWERDLPPNT